MIGFDRWWPWFTASRSALSCHFAKNGRIFRAIGNWLKRQNQNSRLRW